MLNSRSIIYKYKTNLTMNVEENLNMINTEHFKNLIIPLNNLSDINLPKKDMWELNDNIYDNITLSDEDMLENIPNLTKQFDRIYPIINNLFNIKSDSNWITGYLIASLVIPNIQTGIFYKKIQVLFLGLNRSLSGFLHFTKYSKFVSRCSIELSYRIATLYNAKNDNMINDNDNFYELNPNVFLKGAFNDGDLLKSKNLIYNKNRINDCYNNCNIIVSCINTGSCINDINIFIVNIMTNLDNRGSAVLELNNYDNSNVITVERILVCCSLFKYSNLIFLPWSNKWLLTCFSKKKSLSNLYYKYLLQYPQACLFKKTYWVDKSNHISGLTKKFKTGGNDIKILLHKQLSEITPVQYILKILNDIMEKKDY